MGELIDLNSLIVCSFQSTHSNHHLRRSDSILTGDTKLHIRAGNGTVNGVEPEIKMNKDYQINL